MRRAINTSFWCDKRVFLTGHTGFKGSWLSLWLSHLGAHVHGYALEPPSTPSFFDIADLSTLLASHTIADVRDAASLARAMEHAQPDIVIHMAAQALVQASHREPVETYATNVMGTVNLLEAARQIANLKVVVNVTTDKCYENREWIWPYRENEALGGVDPYSSSKSCSEFVTNAYRSSFLAANGVRVATARAGNVIGGGDWAAGRLIPDFLRALDAKQSLVVRSPSATRPWQHVLEPLSGYLMLVERLHGSDGGEFAEAWNFGPAEKDTKPVRWIVDLLCDQLSDTTWECNTAEVPHEAHTLKLDSSKARDRLGWESRWDLATALKLSLAWHQAWSAGEDMVEFSLDQIRAYEADSVHV